MMGISRFTTYVEGTLDKAVGQVVHAMADGLSRSLYSMRETGRDLGEEGLVSKGSMTTDNGTRIVIEISVRAERKK